jgi:hypothetical protein
MKKIPRSITVTVRNGEKFRAELADGVTHYGGGMNTERVKRAFPRTPLPPYTVTYRVDPNGRYKVCENSRWSPPHLMTHDDEEPGGMQGTFVCFLTPFIGLRVSRKVTPIRGKK